MSNKPPLAHKAKDQLLTLGILSGTSVDAIDLALVEWHADTHTPRLIAEAEYPWQSSLQQQLISLPEIPHISLQRLGQLDTACGQAFAQAITGFLAQVGVSANEISVIGSHGQTVWHHPTGEHPFSLQLGHPAIIAKYTGIATAGDFRMDDIALGGQGAPLAPSLHQRLFAETNQMVAVLNLGGIANLSLLFPDGRTLGFDTGPANTLLDAWYRLHHPTADTAFDPNGNWAKSAPADQELTEYLLKHPFFQQSLPKSTGREDFSLDWLQAQLIHAGKEHLPPAVIQSSLLEMTVISIAQQLAPHPAGKLWLCGGGVHNLALTEKLVQYLPDWTVAKTDVNGYKSNALEAMLFAYLGYARLTQQPIDLTQITGQTRPCVLGGLWLP